MAKGFAIVFMVWLHTLVKYGVCSGPGFALVDDFLGGPFAAPVFMVSMGVGMCYTKKNTPKDFAKRGVTLLIIGLLLNVCRFVIPDFIAMHMAGESFPPELLAADLFGVDILQFAGLAFLFFALRKKQSDSAPSILVMGIVASILGMCFRGTETDNAAVNQLLGYLWGNGSDTSFPFLNWLIFPAFGYFFGTFLRHCEDPGRFYRLVSPLCGIAGLGYLIAGRHFEFGIYDPNGSYYFLGLPDALMILLLTVGIYGANYLLAKVLPSLFVSALESLSKNINAIYCIHWTILGMAGLFIWAIIPEAGMPFPVATAAAFGLLVVSALLARCWSRLLRKKS